MIKQRKYLKIGEIEDRPKITITNYKVTIVGDRHLWVPNSKLVISIKDFFEKRRFNVTERNIDNLRREK